VRHTEDNTHLFCHHCPVPHQETHLKIDWIIIGHHKNLDTTRKQNYQELEAEAELNFEFFDLCFTITFFK